MGVFDYADHFITQLARLHDPARPMQIELHPGLHCDRINVRTVSAMVSVHLQGAP